MSTAARSVRWAGLLLVLVFAACAPQVPRGPEQPYTLGDKPAYPVIGRALPAGTTAFSNESLTDLFVRLVHDLEWGETRPHLIRYEAPVSVGMIGAGAAQYTGFIDDLLGQIRTRAGINIARSGRPNNLVIRFVPGNAFRQAVPQHFCVVAPGLVNWDTFRQSPVRHGTRAYETQRSMTGMTVFIPDNAEPYLVRICLIEEIVQALGPANDFYGLGPSIFNDDAAHVWPTGLDYLMLRVLYAPEMRSGLSRADTRARARSVLNRLNPQGRSAPALPPLQAGQMGDWTDAVQAAFDRTRSPGSRRGSAQKAVDIAARRAPGSAFHCRALSALIRLWRDRPTEALSYAGAAQSACVSAHGPGDIRLARLALDIGRLHYEAKDPSAALKVIEGTEPVLAAHGQAERLTAYYALRAAALQAIQQGTKSFEARRLAGAWGAYALGRDHPNVRRWQVN